MNDLPLSTGAHAPQSERLLHVPIAHLRPGPHAPAASRPSPPLVDSIRKYGVLQPLLARKAEDAYEVVAGFKRLAAAKELGLSELPVRVYRVEDAALSALHAASNLQGDRVRVPVKPGGESRAPGGLTRLLEEELNTPRNVFPYRRILGGATGLLLLAWLAIVLANRFRGRENDGSPDPIATAMATARAGLQATPTAPPSRGPVARPANVAEWRRVLASVGGIEVRDMGGTPRVVFTEPIFSSLTTIDPNQRQRLISVLTAIRGRCADCMVAVLGHTDNDPVRPGGTYASNEALGKLRANAVLAFLTEQAGVPASHLHALGKGEQDAPFPNNSADNKRKNRTVTLEIIPPSGPR